LIYLFIMRALIDLKEYYCLTNMMLIIYANNKRPKGSLLFGQIINIEPSIYIFIYFLSNYASTSRPKERLLFGQLIENVCTK